MRYEFAAAVLLLAEAVDGLAWTPAGVGRPAIRQRHALQPTLPRHTAPAATVAEPTSRGWAIPYSDLTIGVVKETADLDDRVAQSPESAALLTKAGFKVNVEKGAGSSA